MRNSTKLWGLIGAAAIFAPLALSGPALADGGASIGNSESKSASYRSQVQKMAGKTKMGGAAAAKLTSARRISRNSTLDRLLEWHEVMLDANALDHTDTSGFAGDQQGPVRNSRAFAIVQIAVFDAVNSFDRRFQAYSRGLGAAPAGASKDAAIAQAAFTTLSALYPKQAGRLQQLFSSDMSQMQGSAASIAAGRAVGLAAANAILNARTNDGAGPAGTSPVVDFGAGGTTASGPLNIFGEQVNGGDTAAPRWTPDPFPFQDGVVTGIRNVALGANWGAVTPFTLRRGDQFRIPAYPAPGTIRFRQAYNDVFKNGADPEVVAGSTNNAAKQFIGNFWGYDGAPLLGTPPRLYNQIVVTVANSRGLTDVAEYARLLALVNATMGDAGIAAWDSKYFHNYWRPATACG